MAGMIEVASILLILLGLGTNLDLLKAQEITRFIMSPENCSTKCSRGYLKELDMCIFNFEISFKETLPDYSSVIFEVREATSNIFTELLTLDMKTDCNGYSENADFYCTEVDMNVFRITINATDLSKYNEAEGRVYITTLEGPKIYSNLIRFPSAHESTEAIGQLRINGKNVSSDQLCNATIKGNDVTIEFNCVSEATPCIVHMKLNEKVVVEQRRNNATYAYAFKSNSAANVDVKFAACRLDGNYNNINCTIKTEFNHNEEKTKSDVSIVIGVTVAAVVIAALILIIVLLIYRFRSRKQESRTDDQDIIEGEVNVNSKEIKGWTALMFASTRGDFEIVQQLIEAGANVNEKNNKGWTALMLAAKQGHVGIVKLLITKGANVNLKAKHGLNALIISTIKGKKEIVKAITDTNPDISENIKERIGIRENFKYKRVVNRVHNRKSLIDKELLKIVNETIPLLDESVIDETSNKENDTIINDEIGSEHVIQVPENTKAEKKYPKNKRIQVVKKGSVIDIIHAASKGNSRMLNFVLSQGVNIDDKTEDGMTALMVLSLKGCTDGMKLLISKGANIDTVNDEKGLTALMFACHQGDIKTVELLIKEGANVNLLDKQGWNALMHAVKNGYKDISRLLTNGKIKEEVTNVNKSPETTPKNDSECTDDININGNNETGKQISVDFEQSEEVSSKDKAKDFKMESVSETDEDPSDENV